MIEQTIKSLITSIIGTYTPVTYLDSNGTEVIPNGLAGVDFSYFGSILVLVISIYSVFRLIGVLLKR